MYYSSPYRGTFGCSHIFEKTGTQDDKRESIKAFIKYLLSPKGKIYREYSNLGYAMENATYYRSSTREHIYIFHKPFSYDIEDFEIELEKIGILSSKKEKIKNRLKISNIKKAIELVDSYYDEED